MELRTAPKREAAHDIATDLEVAGTATQLTSAWAPASGLGLPLRDDNCFEYRLTVKSMMHGHRWRCVLLYLAVISGAEGSARPRNAPLICVSEEYFW